MNDVDPRTKFRKQLEASISPMPNTAISHTFTLNSNANDIKLATGEVNVSIDFGIYLADATHVVLCSNPNAQIDPFTGFPSEFDLLEIPVKVTIVSALQFTADETEDILGYVLKGHLTSMLGFMTLLSPTANVDYNAEQNRSYHYHQRVMAQRQQEQAAAFQATRQYQQQHHPCFSQNQMGTVYYPEPSVNLKVTPRSLKIATVTDRSETKQNDLTKSVATVIVYAFGGELRSFSRMEYRPSTN